MVTITRHGRPAAVLMAADDLASLHETLFWLSQRGYRADLVVAEADESDDRTLGSSDRRRQFGLPAS